MANDIFNRQTDVFGGSFAADQAKITFPGALGSAGADIGLLVQRLTTSYQQQVTRLYEVGRSSIYYIGGRTSGNAGVDRVVGPRPLNENFYRQYGDICQAPRNTLDFYIEAGCNTGVGTRGAVGYVCYMCVITSLGIGVDAAGMLINEAMQIMFSSFQYRQYGSGQAVTVG